MTRNINLRERNIKEEMLTSKTLFTLLKQKNQDYLEKIINNRLDIKR